MRARTRLVRARAKLVLALELEEEANLAQRAGDGELVDHMRNVRRERYFLLLPLLPAFSAARRFCAQQASSCSLHSGFSLP